MKKTAFILILSLLLLACANIGYDKQLQQYIGQTEQSLIENFGKPSTQKILPNGNKVLTYVRQGQTYMPMEYFYDTPVWVKLMSSITRFSRNIHLCRLLSLLTARSKASASLHLKS